MSDAPDLNELVVRCLDALEESGPDAVEALCREHPAQAARLRERIGALREAGLVGTQVAPDTFPDRLGEFRLLERLGSGGMGVVFLAEQPSLGRRVALKLIRPDQLYFQGARERFRREVEAVARLAHPGIVGVHSVGEERGIPYFTMDHVAGVSLDAIVAALRERAPEELTGRDLLGTVQRLSAASEPGRPDDPVFAGDWTRTCLWIAREVAQALEHAHQRGVLHRDVKPSNIMLTPGGRVLLLDFGLASSGGATRLTRTGSQVGSLPYMAPEQVQGNAAELDARTDVYGLAATLYELLCLRAAYGQTTELDLQRAIVGGAAPRLRQVRPGLSRDVEAVVAVALDPERDRRYASTADFARDLSCVLEQRPVEARPAGAWLQVVRWSRREPGAALAMLLVVVILLGWPTLLAVQSRREMRREQAFNADLSEQRKLAEEGFERSREAVRTMLDRVGGETLIDIPRMDGVRREVLADAVRLYDELVALRPEDGELARERTLVVRSLNDAASTVGAYAEALDGYDLEIDRLSERLATGQADAADRIVLAGMLNSRGVLHDAEGDAQRASALFRQALDLQRSLCREDPQDPELAHDHAVIAMNLGLNLQRLGDPAAGALMDEGRDVARALVAAHPEDARFGWVLANTTNNSALTLRDAGELAEAVARLREGILLLEELLADSPHDRQLRVGSSQALANLALLLHDTGQFQEGLEIAARATQQASALVADFPESVTYRETLAGALINEGIQHQGLDHAEDGLERYERSIEICRALLAEAPDLAQTSLYLSAALAHAGDALRTLGRPDESEDRLLEALDLAREVFAQRPDGRTPRYYLGLILTHLGALRAQGGEASAAVEHLRESSALLGWPAEDLVFLGRTWMAAFAAVEQDDSLEGERALELLDRCVEGALEALEAAHELEPTSLEELGTGTCWEALRGDPRFDALVQS